MEKKEYAVSYYGGHVSAWLCVVVAIAGIMFMLLGLGGGTKSMMVALFFALVLGLLQPALMWACFPAAETVTCLLALLAYRRLCRRKLLTAGG